MNKISVLFCCTIFGYIVTCQVTSYRILGIFTYPGRSHYVMFESLMKELAYRGHMVDVLSHFPQSEPVTRFNDLSIKGTMPILQNNLTGTLIDTVFTNRLSLARFLTNEFGVLNCEKSFNTEIVQKLLFAKVKYDLLVTELFTHDCMLGFAHHFGIPVISMISSIDLPWGTTRVGNPDNPSYIPMYFTSYGKRLSLLQKLDNMLMLWYCSFWHSKMQYETSIMARNFFGKNLPDLQVLASNTNLIFINTHSSVHYVIRPNTANVIEVGGLHINSTKLLRRDLADMLNTTSPQYKGFVYFSMGSMVLTETLPKEKLLALFEAFSELPYQILWKASVEKIPADISIPPNIKFQSWLPQLDILCHSNVKLFVTHGGLMGTQEAVYCGVPCLGIPLFADQQLNINALVDNGMALSMDYDSINKQDLLILANELLNNPSYKSNAETASNRFKDRPMSPLDTAVYWVEYVIRHKGARHLRSPAADLTWYEYHLLDVGAILILGTLIVLYLIVKTISTIIKILRRIVKSKKRKSD